jgi:hypothetical protein
MSNLSGISTRQQWDDDNDVSSRPTRLVGFL